MACVLKQFETRKPTDHPRDPKTDTADTAVTTVAVNISFKALSGWLLFPVCAQHGSDWRETLPKRVSGDSRRFIFQRPTNFFAEFLARKFRVSPKRRGL